MKRIKLSPAYLHERLNYDCVSGAFYWRECASMPANWNARWTGKEAFTCVSEGRYKQGTIDGVKYHAHRIAWAMYHGEWPNGVIDHINGDGTDNRVENLRETTPSDNAKNSKLSNANSSGVVGVTYCSKRSRWQAQLVHQRRYIFLGYFDDINNAISSRKKAEVDYGFHVNHGRIKQ